MASFNPLHWRRTTRAGGLSEQAAEDTATQLQDAFADTSSRQDLREVINAASTNTTSASSAGSFSPPASPPR